MAPEFRILRTISGRRHVSPEFTTYVVETEPDVFALVYRLMPERHQSRPPVGPKRAVLYVAHQSADAELRDEPLLKSLYEAEKDAAFYTVDVRGIGESRPDTCGKDPYADPYGADYFYAAHGLMLDRPYLGMRTLDVLRVLRWMRAYGHDEVHLAGLGWGAMPATFAAMLSDQVVAVTLKHAMRSYSEAAETEEYNWPLWALPPGVLRRFDLPDCYKELESKGLKQIEPWGPMADEA